MLFKCINKEVWSHSPDDAKQIYISIVYGKVNKNNSGPSCDPVVQLKVNELVFGFRF